jgi:hypothetical protein
MITRAQIAEELKKYQGKSKEFKKSKIAELLSVKDTVKKDDEGEKILSDLDSYNEY